MAGFEPKDTLAGGRSLAAVGAGATAAGMIRLLRPQQWVKNSFVAAPLAFTPSVLSVDSVLVVVAGIVCFSLMASAVYVLNDYVDRETDRAHPVKRMRPLASGTVPTALAMAVAAALAVGSLLAAYILSPVFAAVVAGYAAMNVAYTTWLKQVTLIDVGIIAMGFVLRVEAGAALIETKPSAWIFIMTGLLALFLALAKRRDDLARSLDAQHRASLAGYTKTFLDTAISVVLGATLVGYLIYTTDTAVMQRLGSDRLYFTAPFVVLGVLRYLQITIVMEASGSPTRIVLTDRFLIATILGWGATFAALLYF